MPTLYGTDYPLRKAACIYRHLMGTCPPALPVFAHLHCREGPTEYTLKLLRTVNDIMERLLLGPFK